MNAACAATSQAAPDHCVMDFLPSRGAHLSGRNCDASLSDSPRLIAGRHEISAISFYRGQQLRTPARSVRILIIALIFCKHEVDKMLICPQAMYGQTF